MSEPTPRELAELEEEDEMPSPPGTSLAEESEVKAVSTTETASGGNNGNYNVDADLDDDKDDESSSMTVVEHLDELRVRLIRSIAYITIGFFVSLLFTKNIMRFLQAPAGDITFQALSIEEPVMVFFKVAFYTALISASPFILWEISQFVAPGLTEKEKRIVAPALIGGPVLFICGAAFAYFLLLPPMLHFFQSFGEGVTPINQRLDFYMSLVSSLLLYMGLCFQLPIVLFALSLTGLVTSDHLIKIWRYAVVGASVVALVITPDPTAVSMLLVTGALIGLYSITVLVLKLFGR